LEGFDDEIRLLNAEPPLLFGKISLPESMPGVLAWVDLSKGGMWRG
jgi:hypothetical protein